MSHAVTGFEVLVDAEGLDLVGSVAEESALNLAYRLRSRFLEERQGDVGDQQQDEDDAEDHQDAAAGDDPAGDAVVAPGAATKSVRSLSKGLRMRKRERPAARNTRHGTSLVVMQLSLPRPRLT